MARDVHVYYGEALGQYGFGDGHPFGPDRLSAFWNEFTERKLDQQVAICEPVACDDAALLRFHTTEYINKLKLQSKDGVGYLDYGDTPAFKGVYEAACTVAGTVLDAVDHIMTQQCRQAFIPIAGLHHARRDMAAGFCAVNDLGIAIEYLFAEYDLKTIAYVDIDAHHGDGVFYAFEADPRLVFADIHEDGRYLYPGTGAAVETGKGEAQGLKLNLPMLPESDDMAFLEVWPQVESLLAQHVPEFIILQAGADSIKGDPITHMAFSTASHKHAATRLMAIANDLGHGRLLAAGGGGYNRQNLANGWCAVVEGLLAIN